MVVLERKSYRAVLCNAGVWSISISAALTLVLCSGYCAVDHTTLCYVYLMTSQSNSLCSLYDVVLMGMGHVYM